MQGFETQRQHDAITEATRQVERAAAQQLQALQERNQSTCYALECATEAISALAKLTTALTNQAQIDQQTMLNLETRSADQQGVNEALAGQLEKAHETIAELQKGRA